MNEVNFRQLLESYITGQISESDQKKFYDLLEQEDYRRQLEEILREDWNGNNYEEEINPQIARLIEQYVLSKINEQQPGKVRAISFFRRYRIAAAAILVFAIAGIFLIVSRVSTKSGNEMAATKEQVKKIDIGPGTNGAILTLDNGKQIILDSAHSGLIAQQGGSNIIKQGETLKYQSAGNRMQVVYNTVSTPKGKQYPNLVLADGSKVWLDAGSSIRFPVSFTGSERRVEVTGQVWFDVVHNDKMPFKVMAKGVEINDLGTEFNVNAYDDEEKVKITLLKGTISIQSKVLKPGQQAQIEQGGNMQISDVNMEDVIAWKSGFFSFRNTDIKGIMGQLSRWYDVDVRYEGAEPAATFSGKIDRSLNLSEVLKILEKTRVHFRIEEGKKLVILP